MADVRRRLPVPATEVEPRVFASADEGYMRLAVRFVVPIRSARSAKDDVIRQIHSSLEDAGIEIIATSVIQQFTNDWQPVSPSETTTMTPTMTAERVDRGSTSSGHHAGNE